MPTLIQLEYALAVDKLRHFGKASDACHVTQPTLSQQIQKLEDELGIILFDRTKKPTLPTPEGVRFLEQARVVLQENLKLIEISKQVHEGVPSGDFRLAVIPTIASYLLPYFVGPFSKKFPKVKWNIEETKTETILEHLDLDKIDAAILATPIVETGGRVYQHKVHPLYYEPFFAYFSKGHRLLARRQIEATDLDPNEMWLLQDGHCFKDQVLSFCGLQAQDKKLTASPRIRFQSGSLDTLRRLVQKGDGFTLIPAMMALELRKDERDAHVRGFKNPIPTREVSLIYRRDHWKLSIIKAIEKTVIESIPSSIARTPERSQKVLDVGHA